MASLEALDFFQPSHLWTIGSSNTDFSKIIWISGVHLSQVFSNIIFEALSALHKWDTGSRIVKYLRRRLSLD